MSQYYLHYYQIFGLKALLKARQGHSIQWT
jgi:hypothetical protein